MIAGDKDAVYDDTGGEGERSSVVEQRQRHGKTHVGTPKDERLSS